MKSDRSQNTVTVLLSKDFVDELLDMHAALGKKLAGARQDIIAGEPNSQATQKLVFSKEPLKLSSEKYTAEFLGVIVAARTLPKVFAAIVDMTARVAPEALDKLAGMSARNRRFVARTNETIHPRNQHLPTMQTASGWWISKNIGQEDLKRALSALSSAAGLTFGRDVIFNVLR
jgi:hypothetical protein